MNSLFYFRFVKIRYSRPHRPGLYSCELKVKKKKN